MLGVVPQDLWSFCHRARFCPGVSWSLSHCTSASCVGNMASHLWVLGWALCAWEHRQGDILLLVSPRAKGWRSKERWPWVEEQAPLDWQWLNYKHSWSTHELKLECIHTPTVLDLCLVTMHVLSLFAFFISCTNLLFWKLLWLLTLDSQNWSTRTCS